MCQMRIVLKEDDREEVILENAARLDVTDEGILVSALFEQPQLIEGVALSSIDFLESKLILVKTKTKA